MQFASQFGVPREGVVGRCGGNTHSITWQSIGNTSRITRRHIANISNIGNKVTLHLGVEFWHTYIETQLHTEMYTKNRYTQLHTN